MNEREWLMKIEETRQQLQYAQDADDVELSTNLFFCLVQLYESLYQWRREQVFEILIERKRGA